MDNKAVEAVAGFMALAARTAPKAVGKDFLEISILQGEELGKLGEEMRKYGEESGKINFDRDGESVKQSEAVLLLALDAPAPLGLDCGACGFSSCEAMKKHYNKVREFAGPICSWRNLDLGIALGSAVKTASLLNVDNRIMYRIGVVAKKMGLIKGEIAIGVPLSATGKNIFFDRAT